MAGQRHGVGHGVIEAMLAGCDLVAVADDDAAFGLDLANRCLAAVRRFRRCGSGGVACLGRGRRAVIEDGHPARLHHGAALRDDDIAAVDRLLLLVEDFERIGLDRDRPLGLLGHQAAPGRGRIRKRCLPQKQEARESGPETGSDHGSVSCGVGAASRPMS